MTQEEALQRAKEIYPHEAENLRAERSYCIGAKHDYMDEFYIWEEEKILAHSTRSWAHCIAILESGNEDIWPEDDEFAEGI